MVKEQKTGVTLNMAIFNWFGERNTGRSTTIPCTSDEDEEKRRQSSGKSMVPTRKGKTAARRATRPGTTCAGHSRDGNYSKKRAAGGKIQNFAGIIGPRAYRADAHLLHELYPYLF